jgi:alpha-L-rhamnosidase
VRVENLRCEDLVNPVGIEERQPRLSWKVQCVNEPAPVAAEIACAVDEAALLRGEVFWSSGRVETNTPWMDWGGNPLDDRQRVCWRVRVHGARGSVSDWSELAWFEAGISEGSGGWASDWVNAPGVNAPLFRCRFVLDRPLPPVRARLYCSAGGYIEPRLNGQSLCPGVLAPLYTDYVMQIGYLTLDAAGALREGENVLAAMVGGGWYERFGYGRRCIRCQLEMDWADGHRQTVGLKSNDWEATPGPFRRDDVYDGEWFDARLEPEGWDRGRDAGEWLGCARGFGKRFGAEAPGGRMVGVVGPMVRVLGEQAPAEVLRTRDDLLLVDVGENIAGWASIVVTAPRGTTLTLRYAEARTDDGDIDPTTNHGAAATDRYTCAGAGRERYQPRFTYHGFRYVAICGPSEALDSLEVSICRVGSDCPPSAAFTCSDERMQKLFTMTARTIANNLQGILTDCPQRDERQGWLGDAYGISPTVLMLFDTGAFYRKWLGDVLLTQDPATGLRWSSTAPPCPWFIRQPSCDRSRHRMHVAIAAEPKDDPVYTAACTLLPWQAFLATGDQRMIERAYPGIVQNLRSVATAADWPLAAAGRHGDHAERVDCRSIHQPTSKAMIAMLVRIDEFATAEQMACMLERLDDARWLAQRLAELRQAARNEYYNADAGTYGTQTANAMALQLGICANDDERRRVAQALADDVLAHDGHLTPGIIGMRYLLEALSAIGRRDLAWHGIMHEAEPGWLWMLQQGLTTIHEHRVSTWPSCSHNHPANGLIAEWAIRWMVGLRFEQPGCRSAVIDPGAVLPIDHASVELATASGRWIARWRRQGEALDLTLHVPPGTRATVPSLNAQLDSGAHSFSIDGIQMAAVAR